MTDWQCSMSGALVLEDFDAAFVIEGVKLWISVLE